MPNAYHNAEHAADVTHAIYYFLTTAGLGQHFPETCKLAAVLAAIIHDVSHPARTNAFLVTQDDPIAIRYSYRSPLEHMHCAVAFQVMLLPGNNIMQDMHKSEQSQIRQLMVDMVLATDNAVHSMYLGKLEGKLGRFVIIDRVHVAFSRMDILVMNLTDLGYVSPTTTIND